MNENPTTAPRSDAELIRAILARTEANKRTALDAFTIDEETGELIDTPLNVLRSFAKRQKVRDWTGRVWATEDYIKHRLALNADDTTRR